MGFRRMARTAGSGDFPVMIYAKLWPFVTRSTHAELQDEHDRIKQENWHLRGAIREANEELRKHRLLIAGLRTGQDDVCRAIERVFQS